MNCLQCGKALSRTQAVRVEWGGFGADHFCDRDCLWLALVTDRPRRHALMQRGQADLSPQDVVVCEHKAIARVGEGLWFCVQCRALVEVSAWMKDR
jgi:hypothetical protein